MYCLSYEVETLSPVILPANNEDTHMTHTQDFIPGSTLLGILASRYNNILQNHTGKKTEELHKNELFYHWFLRGDLVFSNAYLTNTEDGQDKEILFPVPLSIRTMKSKSSRKLVNLHLHTTDEQTKSVAGYAALNDTSARIKKPFRQLNFHHYRNDRIKGHSNDGGIFHYESLEEGQLFSGWVMGEKETLESLKKQLESKFEIRLGRSRSAQYGQAMFRFLNIEPFEVILQSLHITEDTWEDLLGENEVVLTCLSPVILYNANGYPEISQDLLHECLAEGLGEFEFTFEPACFTASEQIENFISVWKMKKPLDKSFCAGSSFSIKFKESLNNHTIRKLKELMIKGIGARTHEGYGRIVFQWLRHEFYDSMSLTYVRNSSKPSEDPAEETIKTFKNLLRKHYYNRISLRAIEAAEHFQNRPTNHLLGRLELMLTEADEPQKFSKQISLLKRRARDQLKKCRNQTKTLDDLLQEPALNISNEICIRDFNNILKKEPLFDITQDSEVRSRAFFIYWKTFLREMRRMNKLNAVKGVNV